MRKRMFGLGGVLLLPLLGGCPQTIEPLRLSIATSLPKNSDSSVNVTVGGVITFTAKVTGGLEDYAFSWFLSDRLLSSPGGSAVDHTFTAFGDFTLWVTVTDGIGQERQANLVIHVLEKSAPATPSTPPNPAFGQPAPITPLPIPPPALVITNVSFSPSGPYRVGQTVNIIVTTNGAGGMIYHLLATSSVVGFVPANPNGVTSFTYTWPLPINNSANTFSFFWPDDRNFAPYKWNVPAPIISP